jgi:hypothetical protein
MRAFLQSQHGLPETLPTAEWWPGSEGDQERFSRRLVHFYPFAKIISGLSDVRAAGK